MAGILEDDSGRQVGSLQYSASLPGGVAVYGPSSSPTVQQARTDLGQTSGSGSAGTTPSGSGSGAAAAGGTLPGDVDWASAFFASLGLPADIAANIDKLFSRYSDVNTASAAALAYIRGTPWYAQTFPGIQTGIQKGLFTDESGYRDYVNKLNVLSQQYQGRPIGSDEVASYLQQGLAPSYVDNLFQAGAWTKANTPEVQYELGAFGGGRLSDSDLLALGKQQVGLPNDLGSQLQVKLQQAAQRMQAAFNGKLATPSGLTIGSNGLQASGLLGTKAGPDVAA